MRAIGHRSGKIWGAHNRLLNGNLMTGKGLLSPTFVLWTLFPRSSLTFLSEVRVITSYPTKVLNQALGGTVLPLVRVQFSVPG
jgi:hypothetical protein